jgi:hypothetical protein
MSTGEKSRSRRTAGFLGTKDHDHGQRTSPDEWQATTSSKEIENTSSEDTAWEIYNRKAALYDRELVKDWNDSLNTLLIFVSASPVNGPMKFTSLSPFNHSICSTLITGGPLLGSFDRVHH